MGRGAAQRHENSLENPPSKRGKKGEAFRGLSRWVWESRTDNPLALRAAPLLRGNIFIGRGAAPATPSRIKSCVKWVAHDTFVSLTPALWPLGKLLQLRGGEPRSEAIRCPPVHRYQVAAQAEVERRFPFTPVADGMIACQFQDNC